MRFGKEFEMDLREIIIWVLISFAGTMFAFAARDLFHIIMAWLA